MNQNSTHCVIILSDLATLSHRDIIERQALDREVEELAVEILRLSRETQTDRDGRSGTIPIKYLPVKSQQSRSLPEQRSPGCINNEKVIIIMIWK